MQRCRAAVEGVSDPLGSANKRKPVKKNVGTASSVHHPPVTTLQNPFMPNGAHDPSLGDCLILS